jgi:hypothetical protein
MHDKDCCGCEYMWYLVGMVPYPRFMAWILLGAQCQISSRKRTTTRKILKIWRCKRTTRKKLKIWRFKNRKKNNDGTEIQENKKNSKALEIQENNMKIVQL